MKREAAINGKVVGGGKEPSSVTKQKVAAAKQYIENHYKEQMKNLQERKERYHCRRHLLRFFFIPCCNHLKKETFWVWV